MLCTPILILLLFFGSQSRLWRTSYTNRTLTFLHYQIASIHDTFFREGGHQIS
jgi:hypothetical protein